MAGYSYKPQKKESGLKSSPGKSAGNGLKFDSFPKSKMYVAMALAVLSLMVVGGSSITGNLIGTDPEYAELSQMPGFPDLSKQSANVEYYKCSNSLESLQSQYDQCSTGLSSMKDAYNTCMTDKGNVATQLSQTSTELQTCKTESATFKTERDMCVNEKSSMDVTLGTCNSELNEATARNVELDRRVQKILENYAKQVCCIQKQFQPSLGYYRVENNKIICTDDDDDVEFDCD